jgi:hypothetical protein
MDALFRCKAAFETSKPQEEITIEHLWTGNDLGTKPTATCGAPSAGKPRTIISMETIATRSKFSGTGCRRRGNRNNGREVGRFDGKRIYGSDGGYLLLGQERAVHMPAMRIALARRAMRIFRVRIR